MVHKGFGYGSRILAIIECECNTKMLSIQSDSDNVANSFIFFAATIKNTSCLQEGRILLRCF